MRAIPLSFVFAMLATSAFATTADTLAEGRAKLSAGDSIAAEALFQEIVESEDALPLEVQEALFWQLSIYSGDFSAATQLMLPIQAAYPEDHPLKRRIAQQMGLARWAFCVASENFLNSSVMGADLEEVKLVLPHMNKADVEMLMATIRNPDTLNQILSNYDTDPSVAEGLILKTDQYCMYLAIADSIPGLPESRTEEIAKLIASGKAFSETHFLDWIARVAADMDLVLSEPNGPDLQGIKRRCEERIRKIEGN